MSNRGDLLRVQAQFERTQAKQETRLDRFLALMGDGEGNLEVPGVPLFVYVRVQGRGVVECLNRVAPLRSDLPLVVGYDFKRPDTLQVLSIYEGGMASFGPYAYLPPHHQAHEFRNADGGDDVVWIQKQAVIPLLCRPTSPTSMFVEVLEDNYPWLSGWNLFPGATSADLTPRVPGAGNARFVLIYVDGATNVLGYSNGAPFPTGWPPGTAFSLTPAPPAGTVPVAAIYLPNGITAIDWDNIYDVRLFNQPIGGSVTPGPHALLDNAVHSDTVTSTPPARGSLVVADATPEWDELLIGTAQQLLKVNAGGTDPEWGEPPISSIAGYARGSIFRGGAADWEVYDAKTDAQILVGDGVDVASVPVTQDVALINTGATTVVGIRARTVAAGAPADGQVYAWNNVASEWQPVDQSGGPGGGNPIFKADGALIVLTNIDGAYVVPSDATITAVYIHCGTTGTAGSTIVDVNKNGVTIFTVQANRPALAWNDPDGVAKSGVPDVVALAENDVLTVDIDQIATASEDLSVIVALSVSGGASAAKVFLEETHVDFPNGVIDPAILPYSPARLYTSAPVEAQPVLNGASLTVLDVSDVGTIKSIWFAAADGASNNPVMLPKIEVYIDGAGAPSVSVPMEQWVGSAAFGDTDKFRSRHFGCTACKRAAAHRTSGYRYVNIPFSTRVVVKVKNDSGNNLQSLWITVCYERGQARSWDRFKHLKSYWERGAVVVPYAAKTLLNVNGRGVFHGLYFLSDGGDGNYNYMEGNFKFKIDGEVVASVEFTGTEDYFLGGFYFSDEPEFSVTDDSGLLLKRNTDLFTGYRFHIREPITFDTSLEITWYNGDVAQAVVNNNTVLDFLCLYYFDA